jgi:hypothetical protein
MFEKTRARIEKLEEIDETFRKIAQHLRENKKTYFVGTGCLGVGFIGGKYLQRPIEVNVEPVINNTVNLA